MALIAQSNFSGKNGTKFFLDLYLDFTQDKVNNKTTLKYTLNFRSDGYSGSGSTNSVKGYINGDLTGQATSINANATVGLGTWSKTIDHNPDGTFPDTAFNADITTAWTLGSASVRGTVTSSTIPTIPRASDPTVTGGNIGAGVTVYTNRKSTNFTHTVHYSFGSISGDVNNVTDTCVLPISKEQYYSQIPNAKSGWGTINVTTYSGGTKIGETSGNKRFDVYAVESEARPSISISAKDINDVSVALTGNNQRLIRGVSSVQVNATATPKYSAWITQTWISEGKNPGYQLSEAIFYGTQYNSFEASAFDSRGYKSAQNAVITLDQVPYVFVSCNAYPERETQTSSKVSLHIWGNYYAHSFGAVHNTLNIKYRYKESGGEYTDYVELGQDVIVPAINENTNTYDLWISVSEDMDYQKQYEFEVIATDKISNSTSKPTLTMGIPVLGLYKDRIEMFGDNAKNYIHKPFYLGNYNIDNILNNGKYEIFNCSSGNIPIGYVYGDNNFIIEVYARDSLWVRQVLLDIRTNKIFTRHRYNGVWSYWQSIGTLYHNEETTIGTWFDSNKIYRKVVPVSFPNASTTLATSPHNIQNLGYVIKQNLCWYDMVDGRWFFDHKDTTGDYWVGLNGISPTHIYVKSSRAYDWESRTATKFCIIEYLKNE